MSSVLDWFLVWWLRSGRYGWSKLRRRLFERRYLKKELPTANSLKEIEECLKDIKWTEDGLLHLFDCISYPQVTWATKKDDCDGFSVLAAELLNQWNANSSPVLVTAIVRPVRKSHTVCAFTVSEGTLSYFDNSILHGDECSTVEEVVSNITKDVQRVVCWDVRDPVTFERLEFHGM